jgi:hypothetical protein
LFAVHAGERFFELALQRARNEPVLGLARVELASSTLASN